MECRSMKLKDVDAITCLEQELFSDSWTKENLKSTLSQPYAICLVVEENAELTGYVLCYKTEDEGEILRIAVKRERQRRGIGEILLRELCRRCKVDGVQKMILDVRESNQKARNFYEKMGFIIDGKRPDFYRNPKENAVLMSCKC